jgi:hypothetical protein
MPETPGPEQQPESLSAETPEQAYERRAALAHELVDTYGGNATRTGYEQIVRDLSRERDAAEILPIIVDLLARIILDDARAIVRAYGPDRVHANWLVGDLVMSQGVAMEVAEVAIAMAMAEDGN